MSAQFGVQHLPPEMPQFAPTIWRSLCGWVLRRCGWHLAGELPDRRRLVLIAAPHSSWWDGVWGLLLKTALGADISFMAKRELFRGPLGFVLRHLGGIPIERSATHGVVEQMVECLGRQPRLWLGIAPEGT
ncbi:MAG TPA: 1-acyl-sn-glycerol-3-phosphate acyltransferase, partial [Dokdonella sp.]